MKYNFPITKTEKPKAKPDPDTLRFGTEFTDHMFIMEYEDGKGWHDRLFRPFASGNGTATGGCIISHRHTVAAALEILK